VTVSIGFANTIKPYFTPCYRAHMLSITQNRLDLWDPANVQAQWQPIFNQVSTGAMPAGGCGEGTWDPMTQQQFMNDFQAWKTANYPA
jgi:hypothetical protein